MIKHKNKIIFCLITVAVLTVSFFWENTAPKQTTDVTDGKTVGTHLTAEEKIDIARKVAENTNYEEPSKTGNAKPEEQTSTPTQSADINAEEKKDNISTCSISVRCDSVLYNMENLTESKKNIIPPNGIIFENPNAVFYDEESAFNILVRELKKNKIHFEYTKNPMYNSAYIEGIGNLYEFDCGELSGWLYKVNGKTPSCGCSQYTVKKDDEIEFIYTCNMGIDVGGYKDISGE